MPNIEFTVAPTVTVKMAIAFETATSGDGGAMAQALEIARAAVGSGLVIIPTPIIIDENAPLTLVNAIAQAASKAVGEALEVPKA